MFDKKVDYIILIGKGKLFLIKVDFNQESGFSNIDTYEWNATNLRDVIEGIHTKNNIKNLGFLLNDDLVYVFSSKIDVKPETKDIKSILEKKVREKIPEDIRELTWDYRSKKETENSRVYQIAAISNKIANVLEGFMTDPRVKIEFIEPFSYALARLTKSMDDFHTIVYASDFAKCMLVANKGYVYYVQTFEMKSFTEDFYAFNNFANHKYLLDKNSHVVISSTFDSIKVVSGENTDWIVDEMVLNPMHTLEDTSLYKGKDQEVLNIDLSVEEKVPFKKKLSHLFKKGEHKNNDNEGDATMETNGKDSKSNMRMYLMLGILGFLIILAVGLVLKNIVFASRSNSVKSPVEEEVNITQNEDAVDLAQEEVNENIEDSTKEIEEEVDLTQYEIQILNGTGEAGEASIVQSLLEENGFSNFDLGNADGFSFEETTIEAKESVSENVIDLIQDSIDVYTTDILSANLASGDDYDIRITIGKAKEIQ